MAEADTSNITGLIAESERWAGEGPSGGEA